MGKFVVTYDPEQELLPESGRFVITKEAEDAPIAKQTARGMVQGALDVLGLTALPLYPLERGIQAIYGSENEPGLSPQQEQRFGEQFDTLNRLQEQPSYIPTMDEIQALTNDEIGGGSGTSLARLQQVQEEIPESGIYQEGIRRVTRSLPFAAGGALGGILGAEFTGLGAREAARALGGGETAQTIADITGGLGYGLKNAFTKAPTTAIPAVAEKQGGFMQWTERQSPKAMEKRLLSLSQDTVKDFNKKIGDITDKEIAHLSQFSARDIEDAIAKESTNQFLNKITPKDQLPQQAWQSVQEGANALFETEQRAYSPLYQEARKAAEKISVSPTNSISMARNVLGKLTNVKTSPSGYSQTASLVRDVLHDLTGVSPNAEIIKTAMETGNTKLLNGIYEALNTSGKTKADKLMDLSVRLNDAINYEALSPSVKDLLKPLQRTVKDELRSALKVDPKSLKALTEADELYKKTANRFGKDAIGTLRATESPEKMTDVFSQPSNFENLVKLFGENSAQVKDAERQIVDRLGRMNTKSANELFRQLEPYLSKNAQEVGKEVIALGDKLSVPGQRRALQTAMLEDVSQAVTTGQPPNFTTRAMMTPQGYQTAKQTFARSTGGKELFKTLEKKLVSDLLDSIVTEGQINWQKAAQILDNPNTASVMGEIIGTDGVAMLKNIQSYGKNIGVNLHFKKLQETGTFNKLVNSINTPSKLVLGALVGKALALPLWLTASAGLIPLKRAFAAAVTNPKARSALRAIGNLKSTGDAVFKEAQILNKALEDELE